jgi:hypothetical protein
VAEMRSAGVALSRAYWTDLVAPVLAARFPGLPHVAGRLGAGSDVLGLDDATSQDHDWGLRLTLIVPAPSVDDVRSALESDVPALFGGRPTRFALSRDPAPRLQIDVGSMTDFVVPRLGFDPRDGITTHDWLSLSGQSVLEVLAGPVFTDLDGELGRVRAALAWYPDSVWRYVLAADWVRLAQELPLMGRAADVGDDRGSRLIAARMAQVTMHLAFMLERRWPPYAKWFGTVFGTLRCAPALGPCIDALLDAREGRDRERSVAAALQLLLELQNEEGLSDIARATIPFWDRPHIHPDPAIAAQLLAPVTAADVRALPLGLGAVEQRTDNVDLLVDPGARRRIAQP